MEFGKSYWKTYEQAIQKEWLLTNGIGGFASSTIIGANTRRYHGLLVASLKPPVERHLILSKIDESIIIDKQQYNLYSYQTPDFTMKGYHHLQRFNVNPLPTFLFNINDVYIEKKICMVHGENTVVILYKVLNGSSNAELNLAPLVNFRDYHHNSSKSFMNFQQENRSGGITVKPYNNTNTIDILCSEGEFIRENDCFFINMDYAVERERGLASTEDHYIPGYFKIEIKPNEEKYITLVASIEKGKSIEDGRFAIKKEEERIQHLIDMSGYKDEFARILVKAADDFIVYRKSTGAKTIIAGYPWFTDWGRDSMIALPGLTLATGRFNDAKEILKTFSSYVRDGLIPNVFPDEGEQPAYNTVDAALWLFEAVNKYMKYTRDYSFIKENVYMALKQILDFYIKGTGFDIKMQDDCLISAGNPETQLTWMDAKVGDWVVTPRHGKAVEINALWYNALMVMVEIQRLNGLNDSYYSGIAEKVKESFIKVFWNESEKCLYDVVSDNNIDDSIRPNQIIAVSLSYPVIEGEYAKGVVDKVWKELYTSYGLRTLSPKSHDYKGRYEGDQWARDGAYHRGTAWAWLLGSFITAVARTYDKNENIEEILQNIIMPIKDHIYDACIGSISEIFDGDEPLNPRGCFAQAWSVGEILRAYTEEILVSDREFRTAVLNCKEYGMDGKLKQQSSI